MKGKGEDFGDAYVLSHPARVRIVRYLKKEQSAYIRQIAEGTEMSERLVSFHLSMLANAGFVKSDYGVSNPARRLVRFYELTPKVDTTVEKFVMALK